jgi:AcrR family transcriptional regulator
MDARAEAAQRTRERILQAAYDSWSEQDYDDVSLELVAARAGVTKQTVIRLFGSKDRLAYATADWQRPREESQRVVEPGDLAAAVEVLVTSYERMGDANVRVLALEKRVPALGYLLDQARQSHRGWVERVFLPFLPKRKGATYRKRVMAFYAATDVSVWKLLRRDFGLSKQDTAAVLLTLVSSLANDEGG